MRNAAWLLLGLLVSSTLAGLFDQSQHVRPLQISDAAELFKGKGMSVVLFYGIIRSFERV